MYNWYKSFLRTVEFGYDNSFAVLNVNLHKHCSIISMFYSCYLVCPFVLLLLAIVLSVLLYYFYWPLCCPFFFDIRILITPLVSSNSSWLNRPLCYLRILAVYFNLVWRLLQLERLCDHILISYFYSFVLCWKGSMTTH